MGLVFVFRSRRRRKVLQVYPGTVKDLWLL